MQLDDDEIGLLLTSLETRNDLSVAELDGVGHALAFLLKDRFDAKRGAAANLGSTEEALHIADEAFPNWSFTIHGRANDRDGHWRCTMRENETFDSDAIIGTGRSPVLSQAIVAAVIRLAMQDR
ncbi:hypothetical protein [Aestuariicoccus sp. MJ-SS9]|uniref:hypothetical protein n=1 Tax=Aestuariicoccus sp. MJ-SS9 TaxID=3079855 RepID=UPI0029086C94|nr:hypothetical protein [Aestuariicoccus sp. MJ-SS9]MDU8911632.1 hypothetical protein [Aestuariicoccus sp. MJ-SS9]